MGILNVLFLLIVYTIHIAEPRPVASRGAMSYVVERGCPFLAHYVRDNYFDYAWLQPPPTDDPVSKTTITMTTSTLPSSDSTRAHINWVNEMYKRFVKDYVPMELFKGLVNCGKEYALYAINAPSELTHVLNVDYNVVPGIGLVNCGKEYALYSINAPSELTHILNVDYNAVPGIGK